MTHFWLIGDFVARQVHKWYLFREKDGTFITSDLLDEELVPVVELNLIRGCSNDWNTLRYEK